MARVANDLSLMDRDSKPPCEVTIIITIKQQRIMSR
jgi:hypothetical protein